MELGMEAVEDDICILKHETAYGGAGESPVSVCAGDESVASHFALVTAYEDIKKRLRDTERENTLLRKRVKQLEDKLFRPDSPPSPRSRRTRSSPVQSNKAFSAYRGIYMEKEDLQLELNKLREKSESERLLNEQLQAKEMELLQLKTEMETSQVMKSLTSTQDYWQVDRINSDLKMHTLQEELERMTLEKNRLQGHCGDSSGTDCDQNHVESNPSDKAVLQSYEALATEISSLHSVLKQQSDLVKKLAANRRAAPTVPVQCLDDVEKNLNHQTGRMTVPRAPSAPPVPSSSGRPCLPPVAPPALEGLREDYWPNGPWSSHYPGALGLDSTSPVLLPPPPLNQASLDDSSWSFPSPPKPSDALFWEGQRQGLSQGSPIHSSRGSTPMSPNGDWAKPPPY
uniref:5-azacytidine-induced protein 2-like n=1 Tax=Oncorhynchus gorbuscha TaxID=8017 RepID=UPI001EAEECDF|nr:5-azacytidine-induced protein 2-like [Oncorhynchus gorbuscha]XP_046196229.1 5-azacytidine-induced protein 2-like [Oncorhynchus gorbuscha]